MNHSTFLVFVTHQGSQQTANGKTPMSTCYSCPHGMLGHACHWSGLHCTLVCTVGSRGRRPHNLAVRKTFESSKACIATGLDSAAARLAYDSIGI